MKKIKFIELFSGIGAFTQATKKVSNVDFQCVFASDIDKDCSDVYKTNYGISSLCDITKVKVDDVPKHDFCFFSPPCQAFSKSGKRLGFEEARGTLIFNVFEILKFHKPKYILMENVRNIVSHDNGRTWKVISAGLKDLGYRIPSEPIILSPCIFKVPQTRDRTFLPGIYDPDHVDTPLSINIPRKYTKNDCVPSDILLNEYNNDDNLRITSYEENVLNCWNEFYSIVKSKHPVIGFPIWYDYFHDKNEEESMPEWKKEFIRKNKNIFNEFKKEIKQWERKYKNLKDFIPSHRKFEWQAGTTIDDIWDGIIQFRPSGVRVKAPTTFPALVAIVQIPIYGPLKRRLGPKECAKLQSFPENFILHKNYQKAYKQLGNSINVDVLYEVLKRLIEIK